MPLAAARDLCKMKVSKKQLKRIIKEEKRKILREGFTQEENLAIAIQDYVLALQDQMDFDSVEDFLPDVIGQVEDWFEEQVRAADDEAREEEYAAGRPWEHN
jgi:hypothetical protein